MAGVSVETGVDKLVNFLQDTGKVAVKEVASKLSIPEVTLQLWIDFLVEERIIGIEYKFTKPYIFLNETKKATSLAKKNQATEQITLQTFEDAFIANAKAKQMPEEQIPALWKTHLESAVDKKKAFFVKEAEKRKLNHPNHLFELYKKRLLNV